MGSTACPSPEPTIPFAPRSDKGHIGMPPALSWRYTCRSRPGAEPADVLPSTTIALPRPAAAGRATPYARRRERMLRADRLTAAIRGRRPATALASAALASAALV